MARLCYINNIATRPQKREREKKMKFITTPSHGYLQVEKAIFRKSVPAKIQKEFNYSYKDSKFVYLEEDCEAVKFLEIIGELENARNFEETYSEEFDDARNSLGKFEGRQLSYI